jgi:7-cyano-7-deazaguanine synthase
VIEGRTLVLLSGGIDSAVALALARSKGAPLASLFIDYGQRPAVAEARASSSISAYYGAAHRELKLHQLSFTAGEIRGRNAFLLHTALLAIDDETSVVAIGLHSGTAYRDCSPPFVDLMQTSFDFHTGGRVSISCPLLTHTKKDIIALAAVLKVPIAMTHSCEADDTPCHSCLSCLDRGSFLVGA